MTPIIKLAGAEYELTHGQISEVAAFLPDHYRLITRNRYRELSRGRILSGQIVLVLKKNKKDEEYGNNRC